MKNFLIALPTFIVNYISGYSTQTPNVYQNMFETNLAIINIQYLCLSSDLPHKTAEIINHSHQTNFTLRRPEQVGNTYVVLSYSSSVLQNTLDIRCFAIKRRLKVVTSRYRPAGACYDVIDRLLALLPPPEHRLRISL